MRETMVNRSWDELAVGDSASATRVCKPSDIELFGLVSGDLNPNHYGAAEGVTAKGRPIAHSMWITSLFSAVMGNDLPGPGTVLKGQDLTYISPLVVGDTVTVEVTVMEKTPPSEVTLGLKALNSLGQVITTGTARVTAPLVKLTTKAPELHEVALHRRRHVFHDLIERAKAGPAITVSVCHPCDQVSLEGPLDAAKLGLIIPILVGPEARIRAVAQEHGFDLSGIRIVDAVHSHDSAAKSVALCRSGEAQALMKGSLHTDEMMHEVAARDTGLRTARRISHVFIFDVPTYPRMLMVTDAAINIYPTLEDKADIAQNAINLGQVLGVETPKVAILSAVETVYPKITSTIEAAALCKMADRGQITGGVLDGPLAFDNAISAEAARIKKITSPVAGQADILLVPDLEAGNMLAKQLSYLAEADAAGIVLGARVPIILTSRADSVESRLASAAVASLLAKASKL